MKTRISSFKKTKFSRPELVIFILAFAVIGGYIIYHSFAAAPLVASLESEQMTLPFNGSVINDAYASSGRAIQLLSNGVATGSVNFPSSVSSLSVIARGSQCSGAPTMTVALDGSNLLTNTSVSATSWTSYSMTPAVAINSGTHSLSVSFNNDYTFSGKARGNSGKVTGTCDRNLFVDVSSFFGPDVVATPAPTVSFSATPTSVTAGSSATLTWGSTNATSCSASGAWSGTQPTSGSLSTGAINQNSTYTLTCTGTGGSASASATVAITAPTTPPPTSSGSIYWGAYIEGTDTYSYYYGGAWSNAPWDANTWNKFESNAGKKVSIVHWGQPPPWAQTTFYNNVADIATSRGALNLIDMGQTGSDNLSTMVNGGYDAAIRTWAASVKAYGKPFMLRPWWEMNGQWYTWGQTAASNPSLYVSAWRHWHDVVVSAGATNVTWVWCPNTEYPGSTPLNGLYPGDAYVDWTCMDGYNQNSSSTPFSQLFSQTYNDILAIAPTKPMMIGETGSHEYGGVKAAWITDAITTQLPTHFPKIKALVWFNWRISENGTPQDWPIESSSSSQAAFKSSISSSYYAPGSSSVTTLAPLTKVQPLP